MKYIFYKKKLINGKKRRIYKKKGSKKLYLKHKGRMVNVVKYKKYFKKKQKGGFWGKLQKVNNALNEARERARDRERERERMKRRAGVKEGREWAKGREGVRAQQWAPRRHYRRS